MVLLGGPWRAYLPYRYNFLVFHSSFHTHLLLKLGSLYDSLIPVHIICKCAWYIASGI